MLKSKRTTWAVLTSLAGLAEALRRQGKSAEIVTLYREAAERGDVSAGANLLAMYDHGRGVAKDPAQAAEWYRKSAESGNAQILNEARLAPGDGG